VNEIVQERRPVTTDLACRLAAAFGNSPQFWLNMQQAVDIYEAQEQHREDYEGIERVAAAAA
jgi:addiction module HigA family antidote